MLVKMVESLGKRVLFWEGIGEIYKVAKNVNNVFNQPINDMVMTPRDCLLEQIGYRDKYRHIILNAIDRLPKDLGDSFHEIGTVSSTFSLASQMLEHMLERKRGDISKYRDRLKKYAIHMVYMIDQLVLFGALLNPIKYTDGQRLNLLENGEIQTKLENYWKFENLAVYETMSKPAISVLENDLRRLHGIKVGEKDFKEKCDEIYEFNVEDSVEEDMDVRDFIILRELINNAIDLDKKLHVAVDIEEGELVCTVAADGDDIGISWEQIATPFYKKDKARTVNSRQIGLKPQGLGLGSSIAELLTVYNRGKIDNYYDEKTGQNIFRYTRPLKID
jgi:signal transduction histidine kinase